jgi:phosphatidylserine decarboxylase
LNGRRLFFVAPEGIPFLLALAAVTAITWYVWGTGGAWIPFVPFVYLCMIFRDPHRVVSPAPLGVVSPVDGTIVETVRSDSSLLDGEVNRISIRVTSFGTYTARAPVEGKIMDLHALAGASSPAADAAGLWVATDEGENVILQFRGNRLGLAPRAFLRYGERVGQGQRCAYLRLTKFAEVELPGEARILVENGQRVSAGTDLLAKLPQP